MKVEKQSNNRKWVFKMAKVQMVVWKQLVLICKQVKHWAGICTKRLWSVILKEFQSKSSQNFMVIIIQ